MRPLGTHWTSVGKVIHFVICNIEAILKRHSNCQHIGIYAVCVWREGLTFLASVAGSPRGTQAAVAVDLIHTAGAKGAG